MNWPLSAPCRESEFKSREWATAELSPMRESRGLRHRANWAGNVTYRAQDCLYPCSIDELRDAVTGHRTVKALGSRHSFNGLADTTGVHISLEQMSSEIQVDDAGRTVTSSAGISHSQLSMALDKLDLSLPNFASLPHISVGGAIQTGTHGSGVTNASLSESVTSIDLMDATGIVRRFASEDPEFGGLVVGLGAFGVVVAIRQRVVPAFTVEQRVYEGVRWAALLPALEEVMSSGYSVSLFTTLVGEQVDQVWVKRRGDDESSTRLDLGSLGGVEARRSLHPVPSTAADNVNDQLGSPGPAHARLPHFRHEFQPGQGDEIQSEYLVDASLGTEAIRAVRMLGPRLAPLLHIAEVRRVAADSAWLSPASGRDSLALHFTWRSQPQEVAAILPALEAALLPLGARPHWGKAFACNHRELQDLYPLFGDFIDLVEQFDPKHKFDNALLSKIMGRAHEASEDT